MAEVSEQLLFGLVAFEQERRRLIDWQKLTVFSSKDLLNLMGSM